jgi:hypothetical protein
MLLATSTGTVTDGPTRIAVALPGRSLTKVLLTTLSRVPGLCALSAA